MLNIFYFCFFHFMLHLFSYTFLKGQNKRLRQRKKMELSRSIFQTVKFSDSVKQYLSLFLKVSFQNLTKHWYVIEN